VGFGVVNAVEPAVSGRAHVRAIAVKYRSDVSIANSLDVILTDDFESCWKNGTQPFRSTRSIRNNKTSLTYVTPGRIKIDN